MVEKCPVCGLPKDLCACKAIEREKERITVKVENKRYGKSMTVIEGIDSEKEDLEDMAKLLKKTLACGGTVKEGKIELQGNHKNRIKGMLEELGFDKSQIEIK